MTELSCKKCGGALELTGERYTCAYCKTSYQADNVQKEKAALSQILDGQKQEKLAALRQMLWEAIHEEYTDSEKILGACLEIRKFLPDDFSARFFEVANEGNGGQINAFLRAADPTDETISFWAEEVVKFMLKSLRAKNLLAVQSFIERAFKQTDLAKYEKYSTVFSREAERVKGGVYEPSEPRDVFVMYSSKDLKAVEELVEYLEEKGITCFVALRNLQHGRGAVANYQNSIEKAMKACRTVVFVSSKYSRSFSCDATRIELPYLLENGKNKPRVEYCLDSESGGSGLVKEYFAGLERVYSKEEAGKRIEKGLASLVVGAKSDGKNNEAQEKICVSCGAKNPLSNKFCAECGKGEFAATQKEYAEKLFAAERNKAAAQNQALLEQIEALKKQAEESKKQAEESKKKAELAEKEAKKQAEKQQKEEKKQAKKAEKNIKKEKKTAPMVATNKKNAVTTGTEKRELAPGVFIEGDYIWLGEYPQSLKKPDVTVYDRMEGKYYVASDGCRYKKTDDGKFYKVEPIKWRILYQDVNHDEGATSYKLIADKIIDFFGRIDEFREEIKTQPCEICISHVQLKAGILLSIEEIEDRIKPKDRVRKPTDYTLRYGKVKTWALSNTTRTNRELGTYSSGPLTNYGYRFAVSERGKIIKIKTEKYTCYSSSKWNGLRQVHEHINHKTVSVINRNPLGFAPVITIVVKSEANNE